MLYISNTDVKGVGADAKCCILALYMQKVLIYLPRILSVLITAFFGVFILEGFSPEFNWQDSLMHFFVALAPLTGTILAWKKPKLGGWIFLAFGCFWLLKFNDLSLGSILISGIPVITGMLFLAEGYFKKQIA